MFIKFASSAVDRNSVTCITFFSDSLISCIFFSCSNLSFFFLFLVKLLAETPLSSILANVSFIASSISFCCISFGLYNFVDLPLLLLSKSEVVFTLLFFLSSISLFLYSFGCGPFFFLNAFFVSLGVMRAFFFRKSLIVIFSNLLFFSSFFSIFFSVIAFVSFSFFFSSIGFFSIFFSSVFLGFSFLNSTGFFSFFFSSTFFTATFLFLLSSLSFFSFSSFSLSVLFLSRKAFSSCFRFSASFIFLSS